MLREILLTTQAVQPLSGAASTENGKNHRWFCAMCLKRREEWLRQAASPTPQRRRSGTSLFTLPGWLSITSRASSHRVPVHRDDQRHQSGKSIECVCEKIPASSARGTRLEADAAEWRRKEAIEERHIALSARDSSSAGCVLSRHYLSPACNLSTPVDVLPGASAPRTQASKWSPASSRRRSAGLFPPEDGASAATIIAEKRGEV